MEASRNSKITAILLMSLISILMIFPFFWTLSGSLKSAKETLNGFSLFPEGAPWDWQWGNYKSAMEIMNFGRSLLNTIIITVPKLFGDIFVSALIAYGFARFDFKFKKPLFMILIATLMIPFEITMIPLFIAYAQIGWIDTYLPLIIPALFGASQFIFFMTMYYITMPKELVESAQVDGLSDLGIFRKIYLPLSVPALVVITIWSIQGTWNDLLGPLIWLQSPEKFTLQLSLASLSNTTTVNIEQGIILAGTVLVMIPLLLLFVRFQSYILNPDKTSGIK